MSSKSKILYQKKQQEKVPIQPNELRVGSSGRIKSQVSQGASLFMTKNFDTILIKATGNAIAKSISIAEVLKRRIPDLHQDLSVTSLAIREEQLPKETGLDTVCVDRMTTNVTITLSKLPLDSTAYGYQTPLPADQVEQLTLEQLTRGGGHSAEAQGRTARGRRGGAQGSRGRGSGSRGRTNQFPREDEYYNDRQQDTQHERNHKDQQYQDYNQHDQYQGKDDQQGNNRQRGGHQKGDNRNNQSDQNEDYLQEQDQRSRRGQYPTRGNSRGRGSRGRGQNKNQQ